MRSSPWKRRQLLHSSPEEFNHIATITPSNCLPHDFKDRPIASPPCATQRQKSWQDAPEPSQTSKPEKKARRLSKTPSIREGIAMSVQILLWSCPARSCYGPF